MERLMSILQDITEVYSEMFAIEKLDYSNEVIISPDDIAGDEYTLNEFINQIRSSPDISKLGGVECVLGENLTDIVIYPDLTNLVIEKGKNYDIYVDLNE